MKKLLVLTAIFAIGFGCSSQKNINIESYLREHHCATTYNQSGLCIAFRAPLMPADISCPSGLHCPGAKLADYYITRPGNTPVGIQDRFREHEGVDIICYFQPGSTKQMPDPRPNQTLKTGTVVVFCQ